MTGNMEKQIATQPAQPKISPQDAQQALVRLDFLICNKTTATLNELNNATTAICALGAFIAQSQSSPVEPPKKK